MKLTSDCDIIVDTTISLQILTLDDAPDYFGLINQNRAYLREWLTWVDTIVTAEDAENDLRKRYIAFCEQRKVMYGIRLHGELVGRITLSEQRDGVNIGYFLAESHQGNGIVTRALRQLIQHAFTHFDVHRFILLCQDINHSSKAIAQRLGFAFEGIARERLFIHGQYRDINVYARLKSTPCKSDNMDSEA